MEKSQKSHAIELSLFLWSNARWHHWKCGFTQLEAATINHLHNPVKALMFGCSGTQIDDVMLDQILDYIIMLVEFQMECFHIEAYSFCNKSVFKFCKIGLDRPKR